MTETAAAELAPGPVRVVMIVLSLLNAIGAAGGAAMLLTSGLGDLDVGATRLGTLGFTNWVPGGVALALGVAVPMALAGVLVWAGHPWGPTVLLLAGLALMAWIVVQVTFIGFGSWLQPLYFVIGAACTGGGMLLVRAAG